MAKPKIIEDIESLQLEVTNARNGKANLKTKIDEIDTTLTSHTSSLADISNQTYITEKAKTSDVNTALALKANQSALDTQKTRIDTLVQTSGGSFYEKCLQTDTGALLVVSSGATTGQINLASVTPVATGYTPAVNDYVRLVYGVASGSSELIDARTNELGDTKTTIGNAIRDIAKRKMTAFSIDVQGSYSDAYTNGSDKSLVPTSIKNGKKYFCCYVVKGTTATNLTIVARQRNASWLGTALALTGSTNGVDALYYGVLEITDATATQIGFIIYTNGSLLREVSIYDVSDMSSSELSSYKFSDMWKKFGTLVGLPKNYNLMSMISANESSINTINTNITALQTSVFGKTSIVNCYGDSLTAGAGATTSGGWVSLLRNQMTADGYVYTVNNKGMSGDSAQQIVNRMGALPLYLRPFTLPSRSGTNVSVPIQFYDNAMGAVNYQSFLVGVGDHPYINGTFYGYIGGDVSGNSLIRQIDGSEVNFPRPTLLTFGNQSDDNRKAVTIIWAGTNNLSSTVADIIQYQKYMVDFLKSDNYFVVGLTADTYHADIDAKNTAMSKQWGRKFIDIKKYLIEFGLSDNGLTPTTTDNQNISNNIIPRSLLGTDQIHFNEYGYISIKNYIYQKLKDEGYISK